MSTSILHVKPDPRGRLAISKAIDAVNRRLSTLISGFDVLLNEDGSLTLKPMVEVPAESAVVLSHADWQRFHEIIEDDADPNAALKQAAAKTAKDRVLRPGHVSRRIRG